MTQLNIWEKSATTSEHHDTKGISQNPHWLFMATVASLVRVGEADNGRQLGVDVYVHRLEGDGAPFNHGGVDVYVHHFSKPQESSILAIKKP